MLEEKITQDEMILYEVMRHPIFFGEFYRQQSQPDHEAPFEYTIYQLDYLCDFSHFVSLCCGRAVGKCHVKGTRILNTINGSYKNIEDIFNDTGSIKLPTLKKDLSQGQNTGKITFNGYAKALKIVTEKGFENSVTEEHPFYTNHGWVTASNIKIGDYLAVPRSLPYFGDVEIDEKDLIYLAHFIAEGTYKTGSISTTEPEVIKELYDFAKYRNMSVRKDKTSYCFSGSYRIKLLDEHDLRFCHSYDKFVPEIIFSLKKQQLSLFINRLVGDDGWITNNEVGYATTSKRLAQDLKHLLLRFGIIASLSFKKNNKLGVWQLSIKGYKNLNIFKQEIGCHISRKMEQLVLHETLHDTSDVIPHIEFKKYKTTSSEKDGHASLRYYPTLEKSSKIINKDDEFLNMEKVRWVKVKEIVELGIQETYAVDVDNDSTLVADDMYSHNTVSLTDYIMWLLINNLYESSYIVYTVPNKVHLEPVFTNLIRELRNNMLLKWFVEPKHGINSANFTITLNNGAVLICRIAGQSGGGANVVGLHTPVVILDEAGYYPWGTWVELQPILNTFQLGFKLMVSGVPTGLRENNVLYYADEVDDHFSKHRTSSHDNPRYSETDEQRNLQQYGGLDSEDYIHFVLGRHGSPTFAVFDRRLMLMEPYPVYKLSFSGVDIKSLSEMITRLSTLPPLPKHDLVMMGIDLGYTDPTAIVILYEKDGIIKEHIRINMFKVSYPYQEKLIDYLDTKYGQPPVIGIDTGNEQGLIQHLLYDDTYIHKNYEKRIFPVRFGSWMSLGVNEEGEEIKTKVKPHSVTLLQDYTNSHRIVYSTTDMELVTELERMTYTKSPNGQLVFRTLTPGGGQRGNDHNTSAMLCFAIAYYTLIGEPLFSRKTKRLARTRWTIV